MPRFFLGLRLRVGDFDTWRQRGTLCQNIPDARGEGRRRGRSVLPAACACHRLTNSLGLRHSSVLTRAALFLVSFLSSRLRLTLLFPTQTYLLTYLLITKGSTKTFGKGPGFFPVSNTVSRRLNFYISSITYSFLSDPQACAKTRQFCMSSLIRM